MPQLDASTFGSQLFWLLLTFALLYVAMTFIALPRIGRTLQTRQAAIESDLAEAQSLQEQSQAALTAHEEALAEARTRALTMAEDVRRTMREQSDAKKAEVEAELAKTAQEAEARLQAARTAAMSGVKDAAAEIIPDILKGVGLSKLPDSSAIETALTQAEERI